MATGYLLQRKMSLNGTDSTQVRWTETLFSMLANRSAFYCSAVQVNPEITPAIRISRYANPSLPLVTQISFISKYWIFAFRLFHTRSFIVYRVHGLVPSLSTLNNFICSWKTKVTILTWLKETSLFRWKAGLRIPSAVNVTAFFRNWDLFTEKSPGSKNLGEWARGRAGTCHFSCRNRKTSFHLFSST